MRLSSMFFVLFLAPLTLPAQTASTLYSPARPSQACPVYMAVHRTGGLAAVQADTPAPTQEEKQMRARVVELKQQIDAQKAQKADIQAKLAQNPDTATSADLRRQLNEIDAQLKEMEVEANQLTIDLALEEAKSNANGIYEPAMGLDLNIVPTSRSITAVDVLVHGFSNRGQLMPARQLPNDTADPPSHASAGPSDLDRNRTGSQPIAPTESFHLIRKGSEASIRADIVARGMLGISWLEVTRIEFSDGSTWLPTNREACHFTPSLYVPVNLSAH